MHACTHVNVNVCIQICACARVFACFVAWPTVWTRLLGSCCQNVLVEMNHEAANNLLVVKGHALPERMPTLLALKSAASKIKQSKNNNRGSNGRVGNIHHTDTQTHRHPSHRHRHTQQHRDTQTHRHTNRQTHGCEVWCVESTGSVQGTCSWGITSPQQCCSTLSERCAHLPRACG